MRKQRLAGNARRNTNLIGFIVASAALLSFAAGSAQAAVKLHQCTPAHQVITYRGQQINLYRALARTGTVSCSTARAMSRFVTTHEVVMPFRWRGGRWTAKLSRPRGFGGPTVYTVFTAGQSKLIKITIAVPVS